MHHHGTKDYGVLTLSTSYYAKPNIITQVNRENFIPIPNVDSTVVRLEIHKEKIYDIKDEKLLFQIIKAGFSQRRKIFLNSIESTLKNLIVSEGKFKEILKKYSIDEMQRAETLSLEDFVNISNEIYYLKR